MREVARVLQGSSAPGGGNDDRWDSERLIWGWPAPRADAAELWLQLAAHGEHDGELLDAVRQAARDGSPVVRMKVEELACWFRDTEAEVAWELPSTSPQTSPDGSWP